MIEFQVSTRHTGHYRRIKVFVYDTIDQLKRACRKRDGFYGTVQTVEWYEQMAATTNSITVDEVDKAGNVTKSQPFVTIRLSRDKLQQYPTEIITHESTHAALYLYRFDFQGDPVDNDVVLKDLEDQEQLCYLVGEISRKVVNKLYEKGIM